MHVVYSDTVIRANKKKNIFTLVGFFNYANDRKRKRNRARDSRSVAEAFLFGMELNIPNKTHGLFISFRRHLIEGRLVYYRSVLQVQKWCVYGSVFCVFIVGDLQRD